MTPANPGNDELIQPGGDDAETRTEGELEAARALATFVDRIAAGEPTTELCAGRPDILGDVAGKLAILDEIGSVLEPPESLGKLGELELVRVLGRGGMGVVYEAIQPSIGRRVALKVLPPGYLDDPAAVSRFRREPMIIGSLRHPNIVPVYATGVEKETPYFVMELISGMDLHGIQRRMGEANSRRGSNGEDESIELCDLLSSVTATLTRSSSYNRDPGTLIPSRGGARPRPPLRELNSRYCLAMAAAFIGAAEGLQHAHENGVTHRDLKPSNLMLDAHGQIRLLDFGLARKEGQSTLTDSNARLGTLRFMSPEQAAGRLKVFSPESDIYGLGATLYAMLAWRAPLDADDADDAAGLSQKLRDDEPLPLVAINPQVPGDLNTIVMKCLRKDPRERYDSAEALALDLGRFVRGETILARPLPLTVRVARRVWRQRSRILGVAAALVVGAALLNLLVVQPLLETAHTRWGEYLERTDDAVARLFEGQISPLSSRSAQGPPVPVDLQDRDPGPLLESQNDGGSDALFDVNRVFEAGADLGGAAEDAAREAIELLGLALEQGGEQPDALYHRARCRLTLNERQGAKADLDRALALAPGFIPARVLQRLEWGEGESAAGAPTRLEVQLLEAKRAERAQDWQRAAEAYAALSASLEGPTEPYAGALIEARIGGAVALYRAADFDGALAAFGAARRPRASVLPELFIGTIHLRRGRAAAAERVFDAAHAGAEPRRQPGVARSVAAIYRGMGSFGKALAWTERMADGPVQACLRVDCLLNLGKLDHGVQEAQAGAAAYEQDSRVHVAFGEALAARAAGTPPGEARLRDFAAAVAEHRRAAELAPADPGPLVALAACQELQGDPEAAEATLRLAAAEHRTSTAVLYNLAKLLARRERFDEATATYRAVTELDRGHALAWNNIGTLLDRAGGAAEALDSYRNAVRSAPDLGLARFNLGWALQRQRRFGEALTEYAKAMELGESDPSLYKNLVPCLFFGGEREKLEEAARTAHLVLLKDPMCFRTYHNLGVSLDHLGLYADARHAYERATELAPEFATGHNDLGRVLERLDDDEQAIVHYRRAIEANPRFIFAHNNLAELLLRLHITGRALPSGDELAQEIRRFEDAAGRLHAGSSIDWLLDLYRKKLSPVLASYASVDALFDGATPVLEEGATLRFLRGRAEPPPDWAQPTFDDGAWTPAAGPIGYPRAAGVAIVLEDMKGSFTTLYVRGRFALPDPARIDQLILRVRTDDGFVAHLNGKEVGRWSAGEKGADSPHDAKASHKLDYVRWRAVNLDASAALQSGENVLAVQGLNCDVDDVDFALSPVVVAVLHADAARLEELQAAYDAFVADAALAGRDATSIALYFEARLLERRREGAAAEAKLKALLERDRTRPEPFLALARLWRSRGEQGAAEQLLREALAREAGNHDRLWSAWYELAITAPGWRAAAARDAFPPVPRLPGGEPEGRMNRADDLRWLTERLAADGRLRINCGGRDCRDAERRSWSQDRFFLAGWSEYLDELDAAAAIELNPGTYRTARTFYEDAERIHAYAIPLPPGKYTVTLYFVEGKREEAGRRRFTFLLEGRAVPADFEPREEDFGVPLSRTAEETVTDGALDIDVVRGRSPPQLAGIEIQRR